MDQNNLLNSAQDELRSQLNQLLSEVGLLAIRLKQEARRFQSLGGVPSGGHNVLNLLHRLGNLTVPQLARLDSTSRQNIQTVVNRLEKEGCVESASNPAHKRSELIRLTDRGLASLRVLSRNADAYKDKLLPRIAKDDLAKATELLRNIRKALSVNMASAAEHKPGKITPSP